VHTVQAGSTFAFTDYVPGEVEAFVLTGLDGDPAIVSGQPFRYVHGFRFSNNGLASIKSGPLSPGDFTMGGAVDQDDYTLWRSSVGNITDFPVDGNNDGEVNAADYVVWRLAMNSSSGAHTAATFQKFSASIPEPTGWLLALFSNGALLGRRFCRL
jgi:hypothetical protein